MIFHHKFVLSQPSSSLFNFRHLWIMCPWHMSVCHATKQDLSFNKECLMLWLVNISVLEQINTFICMCMCMRACVIIMFVFIIALWQLRFTDKSNYKPRLKAQSNFFLKSCYVVETTIYSSVLTIQNNLFE